MVAVLLMALVVKIMSLIVEGPSYLVICFKQIVKIMDCPASNDYIFKIIPENKTFRKDDIIVVMMTQSIDVTLGKKYYVLILVVR